MGRYSKFAKKGHCSSTLRSRCAEVETGRILWCIFAKETGHQEELVVSLIDAPSGFERALGKLPDDVVVHNRPHLGANVAIWFVRSRKDLEARIRQMVPLASKGGLWIAWPKKGSGQQADLSQVIVRRTGLAAGIVDFKISSLDSTWSGLRFSSRRVRG